jgi:hypothetical protein
VILTIFNLNTSFSSFVYLQTDSDICATVRVRIVQDLVLTRDAFNARLEIENGEQSALENILVKIEIRRTVGGYGELVNDMFSIGKLRSRMIKLHTQLWKENFNIDVRQFHQYQQSELSPFTLTH